MPNVAAVLKQEIVRLARGQLRAEIGPLRKSNAALKRSVAALKRENTQLQRRLARLEKNQSRGTAVPAKAGPEIRFSPRWVANDRKRLELSAKDYAALVGVTPLTIYNWEKGKSRPRQKQLEAWAAVRALGKREAWKRLDASGS